MAKTPEEYKLVSFDVKLLFKGIPLQSTPQCTETAIRQSTELLPLPTELIIDLLNLCLTSTLFETLRGTATGSLASVVVAKIVMQNIVERALLTRRQTRPIWLRYVDKTFTTVRHDESTHSTTILMEKTLTYS